MDHDGGLKNGDGRAAPTGFWGPSADRMDKRDNHHPNWVPSDGRRRAEGRGWTIDGSSARRVRPIGLQMEWTYTAPTSIWTASGGRMGKSGE